MRPMKLLIVLTSLFSLLSGLAFADNIMRRGNFAEPGTLDPHLISHNWESHIAIDLFEGLTTKDASGNVIPGVADKWDVSDDQLTYTFYLRKNAKWSNGDPVTAHDFVYSFRRAADPNLASEYGWLFHSLKNGEAVNTGKKATSELGVKALDDFTFRVHLVKPLPYFLEMVGGQNTFFPVHKASVERYGRGWTKKKESLVSNGAYRLSDWRPSEFVELERNPYFHAADTVKIDKVVFDPTEDRSAILRKFRAGEIDQMDDVPNAQFEWISKNLKEELHVAPRLGIYYYVLNTQAKPFDDIRVRQALSLAINREIITDKITKLGEIPAYSFIPHGTQNAEEAKVFFADWSEEERDKKATELMAEAGFDKKNPLKFQLRYNTSENHEKIAIAIAAMWKQKLGVKVELFNSEATTHYSDLQENNFEVARAAWIGDYNDPETFLILGSQRAKKYNYGRYKNDKFDKLLTKAEYEADLKKRASLMREAEEIILNDQPVIPIYYYVSTNLVAKRIKGWKDNVRDDHPTRFLWIEE